jgi:hypothetical protein
MTTRLPPLLGRKGATMTDERALSMPRLTGPIILGSQGWGQLGKQKFSGA